MRHSACTLHDLNRWFDDGADALSTHIMQVGSPFVPRLWASRNNWRPLVAGLWRQSQLIWRSTVSLAKIGTPSQHEVPAAMGYTVTHV